MSGAGAGCSKKTQKCARAAVGVTNRRSNSDQHSAHTGRCVNSRQQPLAALRCPWTSSSLPQHAYYASYVLHPNSHPTLMLLRRSVRNTMSMRQMPCTSCSTQDQAALRQTAHTTHTTRAMGAVAAPRVGQGPAQGTCRQGLGQGLCHIAWQAGHHWRCGDPYGGAGPSTAHLQTGFRLGLRMHAGMRGIAPPSSWRAI